MTRIAGITQSMLRIVSGLLFIFPGMMKLFGWFGGMPAGYPITPLLIAAGVIEEGGIAGDLFDLCRGRAKGRRAAEEITLFKSVGTALEDLAAAALAFLQRRVI